MKRWARRNLPTVIFLAALILLAALVLAVAMPREPEPVPAPASSQTFNEAAYQSRLEAEASALVVHESDNMAGTYELSALTQEADSEPCGKGGFVDAQDKRDLELLAITCYTEAGGDDCCDLCRYRVCDVPLMRRADPRYPDTLEGVLTQPKQYGTFSETGVVWPARASEPGEAHAVERAYAVAEDVLSGNHSDLWGEGYIFQAEFPQGDDPSSRIYCEQCGMWYCKG